MQGFFFKEWEEKETGRQGDNFLKGASEKATQEKDSLGLSKWVAGKWVFFSLLTVFLCWSAM